MRYLVLCLLVAGAWAQESVLDHARRQLERELPPLKAVPMTTAELEAENARALEASEGMRMLDVAVRVGSRNGVPVPGVEVRAMHEGFDLAAAPAVTNGRGEATVRLPRGTWQIDLVTHEPTAGRLVFARVQRGVRNANPIEITLDQRREIRFRGALGEARAAHVVTLAWPDLTLHKHIEIVQGQFEILTVGNAPMVLQAVRRPAEKDPGYVLRRNIGPGITKVEPDPKGTVHTFTGKSVRKLKVRYTSADALPLLGEFETKGRRSVAFDGLGEVVLHLDMEVGGRNYGFYPRPFALDGKPRTFLGVPPFEASVGYVLNGDGRYKQSQNSLSLRIFLMTPNGLMLKWDAQGAYTVAWEQVLDRQVLASGSIKPPARFVVPPIDPKRLGDLRYRLQILGPREGRSLEVAAHAQTALAKGGEVQTPCFPEVLPNANMWARCVSRAVRAYEETCTVNRRLTHIDRSMHMPGNLAGMGGWRGNDGWMWLPEWPVYGFVGQWYWTGLLCHELGHVHGYGHGNPAQTRIMQQAGRRAGRRLWALRPGMERVSEGNRYRDLLEAVTRGELRVEQELDDTWDIPVLRKTGEGHPAGDGVLVPNLEITGDDAVFLWYYRSVYGAETDAARRKHAATWSWWLTLRGYSDPEIQIAMYSHAAGSSLAWLARLRGNLVRDRRIDAAVAELKANEKNFIWQDGRNAVIHRWRTKRYAPTDDLAEQEALMRSELGHRWWRFQALKEMAREYFTRREVDRGEAMLIKALVEARLSGEGMLEGALGECAILWAAR